MRAGVELLLSGLLPVAILTGCGMETAPSSLPFRVTQVEPTLGDEGAGSEPVYLNQEIRIRFSLRIDPLSVTENTVRITDEDGQLVKGALRRQAFSVTFEPVAPLEPTLADGSFKPGARYCLEVAGFPRAGAVRSSDGEVLEQGVVRWFDVVPADQDPSPLLHAPSSPVGFALEEGMLKMAEDSRTLTLYFHEPPMPTTATPRAFKLYRQRSEGGQLDFESFSPKSVKLLRLPHSNPALPSWLVELELDRVPGGYLCVELVADPKVALRDYRGALPQRVLSQGRGAPRLAPVVGEPLLVEVFPGGRVPLIRQDFSKRVSFRSDPGALGFEVRGGRARPRVRAEAGTGCLGSFAPRTSTVLKPGLPFDRGDGQLVVAPGPVFDFLDVDIPADVTVRLVHGGPVQIRACGNITIDGELVLEGTPPGVTLPGSDVPASQILEAAGVALIAAGEIVVRGRIEGPGASDEARTGSSPLTLLSGGDLWLLGGRVPTGITLATEPGRRVHGEAGSGANPVPAAPMKSELPPGVTLRAAAATEWFRLPFTHYRRIEIELEDVRGDLRVQVQVASADASDPERPSRDALPAPVPLPLKESLSVPPGGFVRFHFEATVHSGEPAPSIGGLTVIGV